jgi:hypothetical protein
LKVVFPFDRLHNPLDTTWDRGFAGNPWLTQAFVRGARFILRWPKNYNLLDEQEQPRLPGEIEGVR